MKNFYLTMALLFFFAMQGQEVTTTIYLIRHAEKANDSADSELSEAGDLRAKKWADYFKEQHIKTFYATRNKVTIFTIIPTSVAFDRNPGANHEMQYNTYDPDTFLLKEVIEKHKGKKILIAGNSNTIPQIVNKFIGKNIYKDIPLDEYGNLYIITITGDKISNELLKI